MSLATLAKRLGTEEPALRAVLRVECGTDDPARWVAPDGRPIIRVEAQHVLRRLPGVQSPQLLRISDRAGYWYGGRGPAPARPWEGHEVHFDGAWANYHRQDRAGGLPCEWDALDAATTLVGAGVAAECASWGPGQIMGFNAEAMGISVARLRELAATPEGGLEAFALFLERVQPQALASLREHDWYGFALRYNGAGKVQDYGDKLARAYRSVA